MKHHILQMDITYTKIQNASHDDKPSNKHLIEYCALYSLAC